MKTERRAPNEVLVPRRGGEATAVFHGRKAGVMHAANTRKNRTRSQRRDRAVRESEAAG